MSKNAVSAALAAEAKEFVYNKLYASFDTVKSDRLQKALNDPDGEEHLKGFIAGTLRVICYSDSSGSLTSSAGLPKRMPKGATKMALFMRRSPGALEDIRDISMTELPTGEPLEYLERLLSLYFPILSNPQSGYGEVAIKTVVDVLTRLQAAATIAVGATRGEVCLPLPPLDSSTANTLSPKDRVRLLEGAVSTWTKQIKSVLKMDPEEFMKNGEHPLPDAEISFWKTKASHLNTIFTQLQSDRTRRILQFLDAAHSTYCEPFAKLCKDVISARAEANDNVKYLSAAEPWLDRIMASDDIAKLPPFFRPLMHTLMLVWNNSKFYNTPSRLVIIMRQISNAIIDVAMKSLNGHQVFEILASETPQAAIEKLTSVIDVCSAFKKMYFRYKAIVANENPNNQWRISNSALFFRLDAFLERTHAVLDVANIILQFVKLERIVIGGSKGALLSRTVETIHGDFRDAVSAFEAVEYDILDTEVTRFTEDLQAFKHRVKELEHRLAAVLVNAFEDATTISSKFRLLDLFDTLLERPQIADELEKLHLAIINDYAEDLKAVQEIFLVQRNNPVTFLNSPPIAGALAWCRSLKERIAEPLPRIRSLLQEVLSRERSREILKLAVTLTRSMDLFEETKIEEWGHNMEKSSQEKLQLPLLTTKQFDPADIPDRVVNPDIVLLHVNFDPALVRLLREVKYFLLLGLEVPYSALEIYKRAEIFRRQTSSLDLIVSMYNTLLIEMLPVEAPLMKAQLVKMESVLSRGMNELNWLSPNIEQFIQEAQACVQAAHATLFSLKHSLREIVYEMESWCKQPLLNRKSKPMTPEEFELMYRTARTARYTAMTEGGRAIRKKLEESASAMKIPKGNKDWAAYTDFVNGIVVAGLTRLIILSLQKLVDLLSAAKIKANQELPLLIIDLALPNNKKLQFIPDIHESIKTGDETEEKPVTSVYDIVNSWVDSFYETARRLRRLDEDGSYLKEMVDDLQVQGLLAQLADTLAESEQACIQFRAKYEAYSYLWTTDQHEEFQKFLSTAMYELPRSEEQKKAEAELSPAEQALLVPQPKVPDLVKFDAAIMKYTAIGDAIQAMKSPTDIGWLRINSAPVKQALQHLVSSWISVFTTYLRNFVKDSLVDLAKFLTDTLEGLENVSPDSKDMLKKVMGYIREVKKTRYTRKITIPSLRETVALLKRHYGGLEDELVHVGGGKSMPALEFLDQADLSLEAAVNKTFATKEQIFPLQTAEMERIRARGANFEDEVRSFWTTFRKTAPFNLSGPPDLAYQQLDEFVKRLVTLENTAVLLNEDESLFELPSTKFSEFQQCRIQLRALKSVWDFRALVTATFDHWKTSLWADINTEELEDANKKLAMELKRLGDTHTGAKSWGVFRETETMVKDMAVTLPLVGALHSPCLRGRHWEALALICRVAKFEPNDGKFALEDMIALKLHLHANDVTDLVETAEKEQKVEKKLQEIISAWKQFELEFVQHKDTDIMIIKASDEMMETLDAHAMELQSINSMGKVMEYFKEDVDLWSNNLSAVEEVLKDWLLVTKSWAALESIFLASADIRAQLPDDTKRFEGIDASFKSLMRSSIETPNVVEACTKEGRRDALTEMIKNLELCQKSLNDYLDMKKKIFPRFYFVSNVALLDILSNGNNPPKIMPYLGDCYDSICNLEFAPLPEDTPNAVPDTALAMISKDGEKVNFHAPFVMSGAVERWLNNLTVMQQESLRFELEAALESAVNWDVAPTTLEAASAAARTAGVPSDDLPKPRHTWLDKLPAQIVLVGTQIYWTEETQAALDELESGQEDAVKKYLSVCNDRLNWLIKRVLNDLEPDLRQKIIALITLDVHARDVVQKLIDTKAEGPSSFMWAQQLRFYWHAETKDVNIAITDFRSKYSYEYLGNSGRLVITPLTDRCYITLTLALRLFLGGAPAGPAGTGKTETTKDLARALALPCYVFNCSDQMNYQTMADIFKGLAQTGAWGCFDEFNRINIEVLSVIATQVKSILDAAVLYSVPANRDAQYQGAPAGSPPCVVGTFELNGDTVTLIPTVGMFITMNPGYAGRTELPENLKALFRSCAMVKPDLALICENMLMSEGFQNARPLAYKFVTLYELSSELLSPQAHYDWGLRSVKSVLRVAGALKRADPGINEDGILMRALRDFNTPKMPLSDLPIFLRLIQDLFPKYYTLPTKLRVDIQQAAIKACKTVTPALQADPVFVAKVVQLQELMDVRHSVMLLGPGGCGKTTVWKTLAAAHNLGRPPNRPVCKYEVLDPKAVTSDELYGYMTLAKDWKDGCLSIIMRGMSKNDKSLGYNEQQKHKWVVLDGDIDAVWIESMNTVMDDNKMLTLVSNERIALSAAMRMVFEINSLANATPATVSRAGILYINESDIGWRPFVETWLSGLGEGNNFLTTLKAHLPALFDKYIDRLSDGMRLERMKTATPILLISQVISFCRLLEGFLAEFPRESKRSMPEILEQIFIIAAAWAFGGALIVGNGPKDNYRLQFHNLLCNIAGASLKIPKEPEGSVIFDFYFNPETEELEHWKKRVPEYVHVPIGNDAMNNERPFAAISVPTVDSVRITTLLHQLVSNGHPVMLVGTAGTGKTNIIQNYLRDMKDPYVSNTITMNYYMDSAALQGRIDGCIDKRSGSKHGPPQGKKLVLYIDDLNLPYIETYGTQNSLSLLRQIIDHKSYYDRVDLGFKKEVVDTQFVTSMNPTAGSFAITERLQRNFTTFACLMPSDADLTMIYGSILRGHLHSKDYSREVRNLCDNITEASIRLSKAMQLNFLPDAERFMYGWNMRGLSSIFQGLCAPTVGSFHNVLSFVRLWIHEAYRVYADQLVDTADHEKFNKHIRQVTGTIFKDYDPNVLFAEPLIFTNWATEFPGMEESPYFIYKKSLTDLTHLVEQKLEEYNSSKPVMNLVMFEDAISHICRITRILMHPGGHALLIGVGGSGKQSLTRLAAFIAFGANVNVVQLSVTSNFTVADFREKLKEMFRTAGVKDEPLPFLLTDSQIVNDQFLVSINDILSSGWIPDLFPKDELDAELRALASRVKELRIPQEGLLDYFISRVKANLHVILCFSPVGESFRVRARRFPGIVNCTSINRFHSWPEEALVSVASMKLNEVMQSTALCEDGTPESQRYSLGSNATFKSVCEHMAYVHMSVTQVSDDFKEKMRRYNYVTPKSFLELTKLYISLLGRKRAAVNVSTERLTSGLRVISDTTALVSDLKIRTAEAVAEARAEVEATDKLVAEMAVQTEEAAVKKAEADVIAADATATSERASIVKQEATVALEQALPLMWEAEKALDAVDKKDLDVLKTFQTLNKDIALVFGACGQMLNGNAKKFEQWTNIKRELLIDSASFLSQLKEYATNKAKDMDDQTVSVLTTYVSNPAFDPANIKRKSEAAEGLCKYVCAVLKFRNVYVDIKPKMLAKEAAELEEANATAKKDRALKMVQTLEEQLAKLQERFEEANASKIRAENRAADMTQMLDTANRLVNGLAAENERWKLEVDRLGRQNNLLIGDAMLAASFVSYAGAFNNVYRKMLWHDMWKQDLVKRGIPMSDDCDPLNMLVEEAEATHMQNEGLPADRISLENGAMILTSKRFPLLIDPQLQAIKWLRKREEPHKLSVIQISSHRWVDTLKSALQNGTPVIIENVGEDLDATLDPILSKAFFSKGKTKYIQLGGHEIECKMTGSGKEEELAMRLYLQTKLSNPHYRPEIQAQCTIINFIATESGLQDQLLARVVNEEKAELEKRKQELADAFNRYKLQLIELEDNLLQRLQEAAKMDSDTLLRDVELVSGLEATKQAAVEIAAAVAKGKQTELEINNARQVYVPVAEEGAMLYFLITSLSNINHMYQYSLDSFTMYFHKAIREAPKSDEVRKRVESLRETLRLVVYTWVSRGLSETDKLILLSQLTFQLMARKKLKDAEEFSPTAFRFLLTGPAKLAVGNERPTVLNWLPDMAWLRVLALASLDGSDFAKLPLDLVEAPVRFKDWFNHVTPESERLPLDWSSLDKTPLKKLLVIRCLRPDRMQIALKDFVANTLPNGHKFVECDGTLNSLGILEDTYKDSQPSTPIYFILSPGADVVADVDRMALRHDPPLRKGVTYHNISMGQGQDVIAMEKLDMGHKQGHWVILNNVHLMPRWLIELEKKLDAFATEGSHPKFRVFLTSEPSPVIPIGLLNRSIKLTNEPPQGMKANLKRAFCSFPPEMINELDSKIRAIVFGLSYFHAAMIERKKFGSKGYNMMYPFALGDLRDSVVCLQNYMENSSGRVPWEDLRYIFGEIMYGGHIVNDLDRIVCNTYLDCILRDELLEEHELVPFVDKSDKISFKSPNPTTADRYLEHIELELKESPIMLGLHPNAAISTATDASEHLLRTLLELQPRDTAGASDGEKTPRQLAATACAEVLDCLAGISWNVDNLPIDEVTPHVTVLVLELKAMDRLVAAIRQSIATLSLGFEGKLTMSESMELLEEELALGRVPSSWAKLAWPSLRSLGTWRSNFVARISQLSEWAANPNETPKVLWIGGLFNPQSFLTAVRQVTAQKAGLELDKLVIYTEVTKRFVDEIDQPSRDGAYITGLSIVGASFDVSTSQVEKSRPRQMETLMPVINVKAVSADKVDEKGIFFCPVYKTSLRGNTYVFTAQLKTKASPGKWVLAGVCLLMDTT